jgi:hypothetical protein
LEPLIGVRIPAPEPAFPQGETLSDVDSRSFEGARLTDVAALALGYIEARRIDLARGVLKSYLEHDTRFGG